MSAVVTEQPRSSVSQPTSSVNISVDENVYNKAKDCCIKTAKFGAVATCFGAGYAVRAFMDGDRRCYGSDGYERNATTSYTTTPSPWGDEGSKFGHKFY